MNWDLFSDSFDTAQENMQWDAEQSLEFEAGYRQPVGRIYRWKNPGITIPQTKVGLWTPLDCDWAPRITGGGVVFHCPGDIVFLIAVHESESDWPRSMKERLRRIQQWIVHHCEDEGFDVNCTNPSTGVVDHTYCQQYPNTFELDYQGSKCLGLAVRKFRTHWVVQGVLHTQDGSQAFAHLAEGHSLSQGIPIQQLPSFDTLTL